jgi:hypothetical protein
MANRNSMVSLRRWLKISILLVFLGGTTVRRCGNAFFKLNYHRRIDVDNHVTGTVHGCVSATADFCADNTMPREQNSKRAKGRP